MNNPPKAMSLLDHFAALKPTLHDDIKRYFDDAPADELETFQSTYGDHGRIEVRRHVVSHKVDWLAGDSRFPGIKTIAMVEKTASSATVKPPANAATTSLPRSCWPCCSPTPCGVTGISRTACTGCSMSPSARICRAREPVMARTTWAPSGTWR
jgi:hypothetical protein